MPVLPERVLAPDWMARGEILAQDTRCAAVGKIAMDSPTSAMITWAA